MTRKTRTILFYTIVFLFLLVAPAIIFYSQGWRVDFNPPTGGIRIVQTGAFYFKAWPRSCQVYIDGKTKEKTSFLSGAAYIQNLLPKKYKIKIVKENYHPWEKTLEVKEKGVTEAKNILLIPKSPNFIILATSTEKINSIIAEILKGQEIKKEIPQFLLEGNFKDFKVSPDKKKIVYFNNYEIWIFFLKEREEQPQREPEDQLFLTRFSEKINQVIWLGSYHLIFSISNKIKIAEIDDRDRINMVDFAEFENPEIFFNKTDKKLYVLSEGNLYVSESLLP